MKSLKDWTDQEIADKVTDNLNRFIASKNGEGEPLTPEEIKLDGQLKEEYWRRDAAGLHKINCMICINENVSFFDIMKEFCSDMKKIADNICPKHQILFERKRQEFLMK